MRVLPGYTRNRDFSVWVTTAKGNFRVICRPFCSAREQTIRQGGVRWLREWLREKAVFMLATLSVNLLRGREMEGAWMMEGAWVVGDCCCCPEEKAEIEAGPLELEAARESRM